MKGNDNLRTGGQILVEGLRVNGTTRVFCVPGESYLAALDAFHDVPEIELVVCRQESGAAMMADAHARLTGEPGVVFVTRGPGATNASAGVHIARQDSTPLIVLIGQIAREHTEREAFQEIDYRRMFGELAKWVGQVDDEQRVAEYISHAFYLAQSGRPGPVVLALPEDMLAARTVPQSITRAHAVEAHPGGADMQALRDILAAAERPLLVLGGGGWNDQACADIRAFAEQNALPVAVTFRCQDRFDNLHPNYAGDIGIGPNPKLAERVRAADVLLVVGARLGEMTTGGYTLIDIPTPSQTLIHVHPGPEELGRVYQPALPINAGVKAFAAAAKAMTKVSATWDGAAEAAHADYLTWTTPPRIPGDLQLGQIMTWLNETLGDDTILCNGAGNFSIWANKFYRYRRLGSLLGPTSGSMGFATPSAVAAKLQYPDRPVIAFAGDGDFLMTGQELATAVQYGANIILVIFNNSMYGTIRMHQERDYPGRVTGTGLVNPDFAALARAYGADAWVVEKTDQFEPAFEGALKAGKPALIELRIDPEIILPHATLTSIREASLGSKKA